MRRHVSLVALLCLVAPLRAAATDSTLRDDCPFTTSTWTIFPDETPGAPDFWWKTDEVPLSGIAICDHGIRYVFRATHDGRDRETALAWPRPTAELVAARLHLAPGSEALRGEVAHYRGRYAAMLEALARLSGGHLREEARLAWPAGDLAAPAIVFDRRLELRWGGETTKLRGYLDVWFRDEEVIVAATPDDELDLAEAAEALHEYEIPEGITLGTPETLPPFLRVVPNPGGLGDYRISYAIAAPGHVGLEIFDVTGRRVATLVDAPQEAGPGRLRWNARNHHGYPVANGVYFARLRASRQTSTAKFVHHRR